MVDWSVSETTAMHTALNAACRIATQPMCASLFSVLTSVLGTFATARLVLLPISAKHGTGLYQFDVSLYVGWKEEPPLLKPLGGLCDCSHVAVVVRVAFFERAARVAGGQTFRPRDLVRDVLAVGFAAFVLAELSAPQRPAGGRRDRRLDRRQPDAGDFIAV